MLIAVVVAGCVSLVVLAYGWFEAGWLRTRVLDVAIPGLPAALEGVRIGHLSDFHFGAPVSPGNRASRKAVRWIAGRRPDLVCITGDLVSHPRGEPRLREILAQLDGPFVVLGNHDVAVTRDPFSQAAELRDLERARLLRDEAVSISIGGEPVSIVGVDPTSHNAGTARPEELSDPEATFRLLLCHFPEIVDALPPESFHLVLAGHLHAGQICLPSPWGRVLLAHPRAPFVAGLYATPAGTMHVSPGTGTTFVPFRLFARPEVTELVLHPGDHRPRGDSGSRAIGL